MLAIFHKKFVFSGNDSGRDSAVTASSHFAGIMEKAFSSAKSMEGKQAFITVIKAHFSRILFSAATFPRESLAAFRIFPEFFISALPEKQFCTFEFRLK